MMEDDAGATPKRPAFIGMCDVRRGSVSGTICSNDSANGELNVAECVLNEKGRPVMKVAQVVAAASIRGRSTLRRGSLRSKSLCNKNSLKKDRLTQADLSNWAHLFAKRRGRSLDSRVDPLGEKVKHSLSLQNFPAPSSLCDSLLPPAPLDHLVQGGHSTDLPAISHLPSPSSNLQSFSENFAADLTELDDPQGAQWGD